jgi:hypothetical protein
MNLTINDLPKALNIARYMACFGTEFNEATKNRIRDEGFGGLASTAHGCLRWIWTQWLAGAPATDIQSQVQAFVLRGMELRSLSSRSEWRGRHDLFFLHCAIFVSPEIQLKALAEQVVDASGFEGRSPEERFGELHASAWSGMLKYAILGNPERAVEQANIAWKARQDNSFHTAAKSLVTPWLEQDWKAFAKAQEKDFRRLWGRLSKDPTVMSQSGDNVAVNTLDISIPQIWCWAHCGLAILAHRQFGAKVATDPLWFPRRALEVVPG